MGGDQPLISVVTPVGPRHREHVTVARASLESQTIPRSWWEHIVELDTDRSGPAKTRNRGLARARGLFTVFLDADDYLLPSALETYLRAYASTQAAYIYADNYVIGAGGAVHYSSSQDYNQLAMAHYNVHVVTALVPTIHARLVGGFDEGVDAWEDWTLWLRLAIAGLCGERVPLPALVYRITEGDRMQRFLGNGPENVVRMQAVTSRYTNEEGRIRMAGCCGRGNDGGAGAAAQAAVLALPPPEPAGDLPAGTVRMQYTGPQLGSFTLRSPWTGQSYKAGRGRLVDITEKHAQTDVPWLESMEGWRRVAAVAPFAPPPPPAAIYDEGADAPVLALGPDENITAVRA
jgi:hypothetical protein